MSSRFATLFRNMRAIRSQLSGQRDLSLYRDDFAAYACDVLGVQLTATQKEIGRAVLQPPYRMLVSSGQDVGKTYMGAALVSWWYDSRDPSVALTTAPKLAQVKDLLWKEIRAQRRRAGLGDFAGPKALRLESSARHFAKGVTANSQEGFQGHHEGSVLVVIDEAEGVDRSYFEAAKTMASGAGHAIVCFYNPYSSGSHVAQEESALDEHGKPSWRLIRMSSLDHPNIEAELKGEPPSIPQAVRLAKVGQWIQDWCQALTGDDIKATDIEWPPSAITGKAGRWYRPGPRMEAGALGRRPTQAVDTLWSVPLVDACIARSLPIVGALQIGCDVARFGDDDTAMHVKIGGCSVHHEAVNGWNTVQIARRLQGLAGEWGRSVGIDARHVPIAIDDCGVGGGVTDILGAKGFNVAGINVSVASPDEDRYPNLRSALWCDLADEAVKGNVDLSRVPRDIQQQFRRELPAQQYRLDARGRRCVLSKEATKAILGRSPDNADALCLAYCNVQRISDRVTGRVEVIQ